MYWVYVKSDVHYPAVVAEAVSLHEGFCPYHSQFGMGGFGRGKIAVAHGGIANVSRAILFENLSPDAFTNLHFIGAVRFLDDIPGHRVFEIIFTSVNPARKVKVFVIGGIRQDVLIGGAFDHGE